MQQADRQVERRRAAMVDAFEQHYAATPTVWSRAPGRVDLMGSHTDYNDGFVMTMAIERDTWVAARPRNDRRVRAYSLNAGSGTEFALDHIQRDSDESTAWSNYLRGMAAELGAAGYQLRGFDAVIHSTVPLGSGLSSSAALEMATGVACAEIGGFSVDAVEMARLGQRAENEFVGVNCGILDQFSSALGRAGCAMLLDCRDLTVETVPIDRHISVVICDTKVERRLGATAYAERREQCATGVRVLHRLNPQIRALRDVSLDELRRAAGQLAPVVARRCRFIVEENLRVARVAAALRSGDREQLAELFAASYRGAHDLYAIGAPAMEAMVEATRAAPGHIATRQAGAGFGGCMVALVEPQQIDTFSDAVRRSYRRRMDIDAAVYPVAAASGAGLIDVR